MSMSMRTIKPTCGMLLAAAILVVTPAHARAQDPKAEIGASLAGAVVGLGDNDFTVFGVPSGFGVFGLGHPGVYSALFLGRRLAVEPQIGLLVVSGDGDTNHLVNFVGQIDYFLGGLDRPAPYVFAAAGIVDVSGSSQTPKSVGAGVGYRIPVGDRLVFRFDGRYTHYTDDDGNVLAFGVSIGGLFR
jgi:hypothetical protein